MARLVTEVQEAERHRKCQFIKHEKIPLSEHLAEFKVYLAAKANTANHGDKTARQAGLVITGCGFTMIDDISAGRVAEWLADLRKDEVKGDRTIPGMSICNSNHYLRSIKSFARGLVKDRRAREDVLQQPSMLDSAADRRHERRAMSQDEFNRLVQAVHEGKPFRYVEGEARAMLYTVAAATCFRAGELASFTPESFTLHAEPVTVTIAASYSKRRRRDVQPLPSALVPILRKFLEGRRAGERVWPGTWRDAAAEMLRVDLEAAGIPYADDAGHVFDFHALRGQFFTSLRRAGVPLVTAQKLARHCDPKLTANVYTHLAMIDLAGAVESLPIPFALPLAHDRCTRLQLPASSPDANRMKTAGLHLAASPCTMAVAT